MDKVDWTLTRSFLAVAETGSLSEAARALHLSQPTLGRHIAEIEAALGLALFTRQPRGLTPTEAAIALLPHARAMRDAAASLTLAAAGRDADLHGTVRITASQVVAFHILPAMLTTLRTKHPGIDVEVVPTDTTENLHFREADIALRMYRPTQENVVTRHLTDLPTALYAAHSQITRQGMPETADALLAMDFVGFDRSDLIIRTMAQMGIHRRREDFQIRCDDQLVYWQMVRAGLGVGGMQCLVGDADPTVTRIAPFIALPALPVWLTAPEALRQTPRIRAVLDHLARGFRTLPA